MTIPALLPHEKQRGTHLSQMRLDQIEQFCVALIAGGKRQSDICEALGASRSRVSRWCKSGLKKYGDQCAHRHLRLGDRSLVQMMWARIEVSTPDDCWEWRGAIKTNGYGSLNFHGKAFNAHRLVYETLIGSIPDNLVLDHTCSNPSCVNPRHLQVVSQSANVSLAFSRLSI